MVEMASTLETTYVFIKMSLVIILVITNINCNVFYYRMSTIVKSMPDIYIFYNTKSLTCILI